MSGTDPLGDARERLGQVLASIAFLRDDIHRHFHRLDEGERRMDRHEVQIVTQRMEIHALRRDLSAFAPAPQENQEPVNSWVRLASALSAVAKEWNEALRLWGRILRWLMLAYLAFTLNSGDRLGLAKAILKHGQEASEDSER